MLTQILGNLDPAAGARFSHAGWVETKHNFKVIDTLQCNLGGKAITEETARLVVLMHSARFRI